MKEEKYKRFCLHFVSKEEAYIRSFFEEEKVRSFFAGENYREKVLMGPRASPPTQVIAAAAVVRHL